MAENPADAVAWNRALLLLEGVGPRTVRKVLDWIGAQEEASGDPYGLEFGADARYADGVRALAALLADLRDGRPLADQVDRLLAYYRPHFERLYDDWGRREPDLDGLADLAASYPSRGALLEALALDPVDLTQEAVEGAYRDEPPLVLSTIHSAKGLEFDTVVLIDALDGVLPNEYAVKSPGGTGRGAASALRRADPRRARAVRQLSRQPLAPRLRRLSHARLALSRRHAGDPVGAHRARRRDTA